MLQSIKIVVVVTFPIRTFNSNVARQMKQLGFIIFQPPNAAAGIQTYVSRVAPNQLDLLKDALPSELPCPGYNQKMNPSTEKSLIYLPVYNFKHFLTFRSDKIPNKEQSESTKQPTFLYQGSFSLLFNGHCQRQSLPLLHC